MKTQAQAWLKLFPDHDVFPAQVIGKQKKPLTKWREQKTDFTNNRWNSPNCNAYIIVTNNYDYIWADVDDPDTFPVELPSTLEYATLQSAEGRRRCLYRFPSPPVGVKNKIVGPWGDIRFGPKYYVVGPGSEGYGNINGAAIVDAPAALIELFTPLPTEEEEEVIFEDVSASLYGVVKDMIRGGMNKSVAFKILRGGPLDREALGRRPEGHFRKDFSNAWLRAKQDLQSTKVDIKSFRIQGNGIKEWVLNNRCVVASRSGILLTRPEHIARALNITSEDELNAILRQLAEAFTKDYMKEIDLSREQIKMYDEHEVIRTPKSMHIESIDFRLPIDGTFIIEGAEGSGKSYALLALIRRAKQEDITTGVVAIEGVPSWAKRRDLLPFDERPKIAEGLNLSLEEHVDRMFEWAVDKEIDVLAIDTGNLAVAFIGSENAAETWNSWLLTLEFKRRNLDRDVCLIIVQHWGKSHENGPRGSSAISGFASLSYKMVYQELGNKYLFMGSGKNRMDEDLHVYEIKLENGIPTIERFDGKVTAEKSKDTQDKGLILEAIGEGKHGRQAIFEELEKNSDMKVSRMQKLLGDMVKRDRTVEAIKVKSSNSRLYQPTRRN